MHVGPYSGAPKQPASVVVTVAVQRIVHRCVCVATAVVPRDIRVRHRIVCGLVRTHGADDEQLEKIGSEHVPVVVVILLAVLAAHDETADASVSEESLVHGKVRQIFLYGEPLLRIEWLAGFDRVEGGRGVGGVTGEGIRR